MTLYQHLVAKHQETLYSFLVLSVIKSKFFIKSLEISWLSLTVLTDVIQDLWLHILTTPHDKKSQNT